MLKSIYVLEVKLVKKLVIIKDMFEKVDESVIPFIHFRRPKP